MRGGPSGVFVDFGLLPDLLAKATDGRAETVAAWSALLTAAEFEHEHLNADGAPDDQFDADLVAADAWRFYIPTHVPPRYADYPVVVVPCIGGDVDQNGKR